MTEFEQQICELYDANPSRQQITNLAKMYQVPEDHIKEVLQNNGRVIHLAKRGPKPRAVILNKNEKPVNDEEHHVVKDLPMPEYVKEILMDKMDELESDIKDIEANLEEYKKKYKTLADYIKK